MKKSYQLIQLSLSVMLVGSLLSACGPAANQAANTTPAGNTASNNPAPVVGTNSGRPASAAPTTPVNNNPNAPVNGNASSASSASAASAVSSRADLASEMQAVAADDATLSDSQNADAGFSTLAIGIVGGGEINATSLLGKATGGVTGTVSGSDSGAVSGTVESSTRSRVKVKAATQTKIQLQAKARAEMAKARRQALQASGAVVVNPDGSLTINPVKLKLNVKTNLDNRKTTFQTRLANIRARLEVKKALVTENLTKLRRRNNVTRTSDIVETTNADGSVTKTLTVEFKNEKTGVMRVVTGSRTFVSGKLSSGDYELKVTGPNGYERTVTRSVVINADGTRTINTEAMTKWANGKTRERSEERTVAADGSATASGTVTVTVNGQTKNYDYTVSVDANQNVTVSGDDAPGTTDTAAQTVQVTVVDEAATTTDTVVVETTATASAAAETTEEQVDETLDADVVVEASASADVRAS